MSASSGLATRSRIFIVPCLLGAFFFALVLGSAPQLHARIHNDAGQPGHICAVTLIASGNVDCAALPVLIAPHEYFQFSNVPVLTPVWVESLYQNAHIFAHAPPLAE